MCQAVVRRLFNPSERCHVRKVARLLAQARSPRMAESSPSKLARNNQPSYCGGLPNVWPLLAKQSKDMILGHLTLPLRDKAARAGTCTWDLQPYEAQGLRKDGLRSGRITRAAVPTRAPAKA